MNSVNKFGVDSVSLNNNCEHKSICIHITKKVY